MIKHYVEFLYEHEYDNKVEEVEDRKVPMQIPDGAYGYRFFSRVVNWTGNEGFFGKRKDFSEIFNLGDKGGE